MGVHANTFKLSDKNFMNKAFSEDATSSRFGGSTLDDVDLQEMTRVFPRSCCSGPDLMGEPRFWSSNSARIWNPSFHHSVIVIGQQFSFFLLYIGESFVRDCSRGLSYPTEFFSG